MGDKMKYFTLVILTIAALTIGFGIGEIIGKRGLSTQVHTSYYDGLVDGMKVINAVRKGMDKRAALFMYDKYKMIANALDKEWSLEPNQY